MFCCAGCNRDLSLVTANYRKFCGEDLPPFGDEELQGLESLIVDERRFVDQTGKTFSGPGTGASAPPGLRAFAVGTDLKAYLPAGG